jgi:hypothetical protein
MTKREEFELANRAFQLFSSAEREAALEEFARLRYPSVVDRFVASVHKVITRSPAAKA